MKKRTREFNSIRNFSVGLINQILMLLLGLVAKNIFLKTLGTTYMGLNGLFSNIFLALSFAEFGIGSVMVYTLYTPLAFDNEPGISDLYYFFRKLYKRLSLIITLVSLAVIPLLPLIVNIDKSAGITGVKIFYALYLLGVVISNNYMYKSHMILADQKNYILSLYNMIFDNGTTIIQIILLLKTKNYYLYLVAFIAKSIIFSLATSYKVKKLYPYLKDNKSTQEISDKEKSDIYTKIKDVFSYKFAKAFINVSDIVLISMLVGTIWVGYYSNYNLIILGVTGLIVTFYDGISASVGDFIARKGIKDQYGMFETIQILNIWIVGFTTTSLFILFQDFITIWLGKEYVIDFKIVILIIINYALVCNRKAITIFREAAGVFNKIKYAVFWGAGINIVLSTILGYFLGLSGILLGTIISTLTTYYWYEPMVLMKDQFSMEMMPFIKLQIENVIYTCISIVITYFAVLPIKTVSIKSFILKMIICLIVSNIFYILVLSRKEKFKSVLDIFVRNYKKLKRKLGVG